MKKIITVVILLILVTTSNFATEKSNTIPDIKDHWAEELIIHNIERGTAICDGELFYPNEELRLADVIRYLNIFIGYSEGSGRNEVDWYIKELNIAKNVGYLSEYRGHDDEFLEVATVQDIVGLINNLISIETSKDFRENKIVKDFTAITFDGSKEYTEDIRVKNFIDSNILNEQSNSIDMMGTMTKAELYKILDNIFGEIYNDSESFEKNIKTISNKSIGYSDFVIRNKKIDNDIILLPSVGGEVSLIDCEINGTVYVLSSNIKKLNIINTTVDNVIFSSRGYVQKETIINILGNSTITNVLYTQIFIKKINISNDSKVSKSITFDQIPGFRTFAPDYNVLIFNKGDVFSYYTYNTSKRILEISLIDNEDIYVNDGRTFIKDIENAPINVVDGDNFEYHFLFDFVKNGKEASYDFYDNVEGVYTVAYTAEDNCSTKSNTVSKVIIIEGGDKRNVIKNEKPQISQSIIEKKESQKKDDLVATDLVVEKNDKLNETKVENDKQANVNKRIDEATNNLLMCLRELPEDKESRGSFEYYDDLKSAILEVEDYIYILENYYKVDMAEIEKVDNFYRYKFAKDTLKAWYDDIEVAVDIRSQKDRISQIESIVYNLRKLPEDDDDAKKISEIDTLSEILSEVNDDISYYSTIRGADIENDVETLSDYYRIKVSEQRIEEIKLMSQKDIKYLMSVNNKFEKILNAENSHPLPYYDRMLELQNLLDKSTESQINLISKSYMEKLETLFSNMSDENIEIYYLGKFKKAFYDELKNGSLQIVIMENANLNFKCQVLDEYIQEIIKEQGYDYSSRVFEDPGSNGSKFVVEVDNGELGIQLFIDGNDIFKYE